MALAATFQMRTFPAINPITQPNPAEAGTLSILSTPVGWMKGRVDPNNASEFLALDNCVSSGVASINIIDQRFLIQIETQQNDVNSTLRQK